MNINECVAVVWLRWAKTQWCNLPNQENWLLVEASAEYNIQTWGAILYDKFEEGKSWHQDQKLVGMKNIMAACLKSARC